MGLFSWFKKSKKTSFSSKTETINNIFDENDEDKNIETATVAYDDWGIVENEAIEKNEVDNNIEGENMSTTNTTAKKVPATNKGRNIYYVSVRKDKDGKKLGWEVKKEKAAKITKLCATKEEALALVKSLADNQGSTCIIRKMDGSIQETIKFDPTKK